MQKHRKDICCISYLTWCLKTDKPKWLEVHRKKPCWDKRWKWRPYRHLKSKTLSQVCVNICTHRPVCVITVRFERAKEGSVKKGNAKHTFWSLLALPAPVAQKYCETWNWLCRFQTLHRKHKHPHIGMVLRAHAIPPITWNKQINKTILASRTGEHRLGGQWQFLQVQSCAVTDNCILSINLTSSVLDLIWLFLTL